MIWEVIKLLLNTCVSQAGRLLLNESDFSALQNNFLPYKTYGVNLLDLIGVLTEIALEPNTPGASHLVAFVSCD